MKIDILELHKLLKKYDMVDIDIIIRILEKVKLESKDSLQKLEKIYDNIQEEARPRREIATGEDRAGCLKIKKFNLRIPDCRRLVEIHKKFYQDKYPNATTDFVNYIYSEYIKEFQIHMKDECENPIEYNDGLKGQEWKNFKKQFSKKVLGKDRFLNYMSCKGCTTDKLVQGKINNEVLLDVICYNLETTFDRENHPFKSIHSDIDDFRESLNPIISKKDNGERSKKEMTETEEDIFNEIVYRPGVEFKKRLNEKPYMERSDIFKLKLAQKAFDRSLDDEAYKIVELLKESSDYQYDKDYLQLKAKLLSNKRKDKEAIEVLDELIKIQYPYEDTETFNLKAASIKRNAMDQYCGDNNILKEELNKSKDIYQNIFSITKNYYPAINIVYLEMMLVYMDNDSHAIKNKIHMLKQFWTDVKLDKKDYWSYISNIEFLIVTQQYEIAKNEIEYMFNTLDEVEIVEFMSFSTGRQMEMYQEFCKDNKLGEILSYLQTKADL